MSLVCSLGTPLEYLWLQLFVIIIKITKLLCVHTFLFVSEDLLALYPAINWVSSNYGNS